MYSVGIVTQLEAAHRLRGNFGPASRLHGHTYRIEIVLSGDTLAGDGTLCDIGTVQRAAGEAVEPLQYRNLDEISPFDRTNSTAENLAHVLWEQIAPHIPSGSLQLSIKVWESPQAFASYSAPLRPGEPRIIPV